VTGTYVIMAHYTLKTRQRFNNIGEERVVFEVTATNRAVWLYLVTRGGVVGVVNQEPAFMQAHCQEQQNRPRVGPTSSEQSLPLSAQSDFSHGGFDDKCNLTFVTRSNIIGIGFAVACSSVLHRGFFYDGGFDYLFSVCEHEMVFNHTIRIPLVSYAYGIHSARESEYHLRHFELWMDLSHWTVETSLL
jgi:hypothetical protein